ncbi:hypothetical protein HYH03_018304 [Edaphochlamys debaryana]|uniref:1-acyl-sn-glycerol-3-phosphate acyltransferase n=1 Tax=Edaphochlamys debaryana TaxID=47281 RepID=A0A835XM85_9CHLO|nr:hypothetical protein HYH03_018304 [Edaphochlamys debaryana]|eukprot:KAG2482764.1 hypothetical protein HYH03_018304 [Edaphochlamys debaryana]
MRQARSLASAGAERRAVARVAALPINRPLGLGLGPVERRQPLASPSAPSTSELRRQVACASSAAAAIQLDEPGSVPAATQPEPNPLLCKIRAMIFFAWSFFTAMPLFIGMLVCYPLCLAFDKYKRLIQHTMNNIWATFSTGPFYRVTIEGKENLPPPDRPVVYVANHQSFMDIYSLFHLHRPFKFISKTSNFMIPVIGWSMFLTGHVMLNRVDRRSQLKCLQQCRELLQNGAPVLFFPEGTRSTDCKLSGFKKGAFSVAAKAGVDVVPVTLIGTGALMPSGKETSLRPGSVRIVVHKPIPSAGRDADALCDEARNAIASVLPPDMVKSATDMLPDEH